jgi:hypothetical protein
MRRYLKQASGSAPRPLGGGASLTLHLKPLFYIQIAPGPLGAEMIGNDCRINVTASGGGGAVRGQFACRAGLAQNGLKAGLAASLYVGVAIIFKKVGGQLLTPG